MLPENDVNLDVGAASTDADNKPDASDAVFSNSVRVPDRFATINRMIMRDLNDRRRIYQPFFKYTKDDIKKFLKNPQAFERQLRDAVNYLYGASSHFRRLIQYFAGLSDLAYVVAPYKIDTTLAKPATVRRNYRRVLNLLSSMDIKNQFEQILIVALREDVFFGTLRESQDSTILQQLPSDYCKISVIEDNVFNVSFDFSYFDTRQELLPLFTDEFQQKYRLYHGDAESGVPGNYKVRWQELDAPNSFAVKCNKDVPWWAMPPFAGVLREIFDLEDYKDLKRDREYIENYAMLVMQLGIDDNGNWQMDLDMARDFWRNLDHVLPEEVGSVLSPMPIEKISFERTHTGDTDAVSEAEESLFTAAGVSSLLFNNPKASSNALLLSIKADQAITYSIVKSIECVLNRFVHRHGYGKYFRMSFIDSSPFNRKELSDAYLKAATYGLPTLSHYAAVQGLMQDDVDTLTFLENDVLGLKDRLKPLKNSATMTADEINGTEGTGEVGRPRLDDDQLSDNGEASREQGER